MCIDHRAKSAVQSAKMWNTKCNLGGKIAIILIVKQQCKQATVQSCSVVLRYNTAA